MARKTIWAGGIICSIVGLLITGYILLSGAPKAEADSFWDTSDESNKATINHDEWQYILDEYLISDDPSGINLVDYEGIQENDQESLAAYIEHLTGIDPRNYNRAEQQAFWINLYNALTVQLIVEHYPVESITKLGESALSFGPWDDNITKIADKALSLNNIEHSILRPLWKDYRIHFAVNCASIGCPNIQSRAFTASNTDDLLDIGAEEYLAHPRGLSFNGETLVLSSIFDWYGEDFGTNTSEILSTLSIYANDSLAEDIKNYSGNINYEYDWNLNQF